MEEKPSMKAPLTASYYICVRLCAIRGIKCPSGVRGTIPGKLGNDNNCCTKDIKIPRKQVEPWKGDVIGAYHNWHYKVAEDNRQPRDHDQKDHD